MPPRTRESLPDVLPDLLASRKLSLRELANSCQIDVGFLSRVVRRQDGKVTSSELASRVARELGLPDDYFIETRRAQVVDQLNQDPELVDRIYAQLRHD